MCVFLCVSASMCALLVWVCNFGRRNLYACLNSRFVFKIYQTFTAIIWASVSSLAVALRRLPTEDQSAPEVPGK